MRFKAYNKQCLCFVLDIQYLEEKVYYIKLQTIYYIFFQNIKLQHEYRVLN
jgi:hypothetical protein